MLSLSIALAGFPAQAKAVCPMMAKMMQMEQASQTAANGVQVHESSHMKAKPKPNPGGCCDDLACSAKCSALSGGISIDLPAKGAALTDRDGQSLGLHPMAGSLTSHLLDTQERPPRILA